MLKYCLFVLALCANSLIQAQTESTEPADIDGIPAAYLIDFYFGMHEPGGDMGEDYFHNFSFGGNLQFLSDNNWLFGLGAQTLFADRTRDDVLAMLRAENGMIINSRGQLADAILGMRGVYGGAHIGRLFSIGKADSRIAIQVEAGPGYLQHWTRVRIVGDDIPSLEPEDIKGYDRRTSGFALREFVGFRYMMKSSLFNLFVGAEAIQGFTQNRRAWNYHSFGPDNEPRMDLFWGFKAGFGIGFRSYSSQKATFY